MASCVTPACFCPKATARELLGAPKFSGVYRRKKTNRAPRKRTALLTVSKHGSLKCGSARYDGPLAGIGGGDSGLPPVSRGPCFGGNGGSNDGPGRFTPTHSQWALLAGTCALSMAVANAMSGWERAVSPSQLQVLLASAAVMVSSALYVPRASLAATWSSDASGLDSESFTTIVSSGLPATDAANSFVVGTSRLTPDEMELLYPRQYHIREYVYIR